MQAGAQPTAASAWYHQTMAYEIEVHELAVEELARLRAFDLRRILSDIRSQLADPPTLATRRRKCLLDLTPSFDHELPFDSFAWVNFAYSTT